MALGWPQTSSIYCLSGEKNRKKLLKKLLNAQTRIIPCQQNGTLGTAAAVATQATPSIFVPLADAPITTQSLHQATAAGSREDRKFHELPFILLSCGI
jgi:hypothetical protein